MREKIDVCILTFFHLLFRLLYTKDFASGNFGNNLGGWGEMREYCLGKLREMG
jgi:hypothetical protein